MLWLPPVLLGGVLRFWGISFGLPGNTLRPDEDMVVYPALAMIGGDMDPRDYTYPTFYKYLLALIFRVCMALGVGTGQVEAAWQYAAYGFFVDGSLFFYLARSVTAALGTLTVYTVFRLGSDAYGKWVGIVGALFLSVSVLHVRDSHFGVTDVPSVSFLLLSMVYVVRVVLRGGVREYLLCGVFLGLGASTKYGGVLGVVPLGVAHLSRKPKDVALFRWVLGRDLWIALGVCALVFAVTSPYLLLNVRGFIQDFGFQMLHLFEYGHGEDLGRGWTYHPRVSLRYGMGLVLLFFSVSGVAFSCVRREKVDWVLLSYVAVYYAIPGQGKTVFFRYVLPLVPVLCVLAGRFVVWAANYSILSRGYRLAVCSVIVIVGMAEPLWSCVRLNVLFSREDTRVLARQWIEDHIPEGQKIANVGGIYGDVQLKIRHGVTWWLWRYFNFFKDLPEPMLADHLTRYEIEIPPFYVYTNIIGNRNLGAGSQGLLEVLENDEVAYVVTHQHPLPSSMVNPEFLRELERRATLMLTFSPGDWEDLQGAVYDLQDAFYAPISGFGGLVRTGPVVKIWRIEGRVGYVFRKPGGIHRLFAENYMWLGNSEVMRDNLEVAESNYKRSLRFYPDLARARIFLGLVYLVQSRFQDARREIKRAIDEGFPPRQIESTLFWERTRSGELYSKLGVLWTMLKDHPSAASAYIRSISLGYQQPEVYNNLGVVYFAMEKYEEAGEVFRKALELDPDYADAKHNLERLTAREK